MKQRIIAIMMAFAMIFSLLPAFAAEGAEIYASVTVDSATKTINVDGTIYGGGKFLSIYLLYPGKSVNDILFITEDNPVISHVGQIPVAEDGNFTYEFRHRGTNGLYTLCLRSGEQYVECKIDTTKDSQGMQSLKGLKDLPKSFSGLLGDTVRDRFFSAKNELPDEMPVVIPVQPAGYRALYVSTTGTDKGDGSFENPYPTLQAALKSLDNPSGVAIYLRGGKYSASDIGLINGIQADEKAPLYISAYSDEKVTVEGGSHIGGSSFSKVTEKAVLERLSKNAQENVYYVDLKNLGINYQGTFTSESRPALYIGNDKYQISRWPNNTTTKMREYTEKDNENGVIDSGPITTSVGSKAGALRSTGLYGGYGFEIVVDELRPFHWKEPEKAWMYGSFYAEWTRNHVKVQRVNPEKRSVRTANGLMWGAVYQESNNFYYYNILEELDVPGEWYADSEKGRLYLYPKTNLTDVTITLADNSEPICSIKNSKNIILNGLTFEKTMKDGIQITDSESVVLQNCIIDNCGGDGMKIEGNSKYCGITTSQIQNTEGDAWNVSATDEIKRGLIPQRNFLQNSYVYNCKAARTNGVGNIVSHNVVSNSIGSSLYLLSGGENVFEYNEILCGPRDIKDSGAIYVSGNNHAHRGEHVRYNYIHHSNANCGIYLDDMVSNIYVYGNILEGSKIFIHSGSENSVYNNIITDATVSPIEDSINYFRSYDERWITSALGQKGITSYMKNGYSDKEPWLSRYPMLNDFTEKMQLRINEYEKDSSLLSKILVNYYTGEVLEDNSGVVFESDDRLVNKDKWDGRFDTTNTITDLDTYLRAPRNQHIENNILIGSYKDEWITPLGRRTAHYIPSTMFMKAGNPFADGNYASSEGYETVRKKDADFETIPFEKNGIIKNAQAWKNYLTMGTPEAESTSSESVKRKDLTFMWTSVPGAGTYVLEISQDENFSNIIGTYTTQDMSYTISDGEALLKDNTSYFWRVRCISGSDKVSGDEKISKTFTFKVDESQAENVVVGITGTKTLTVDDERVVEFMPYNADAVNRPAYVYAAVYSPTGTLINLKCYPVGMLANEFEDELYLELGTADDCTVKFFIWSQDDKMVPYVNEIIYNPDGSNTQDTSNRFRDDGADMDNPKVIGVIGDSITHHSFYLSFLEHYYDTRYPNENIKIVNKGISGDTAPGVLDRLKWDVFNADNYQDCDEVVMMIGMNDIGYSRYTAERPSTESLEQDSEKNRLIKNGLASIQKIVDECKTMNKKITLMTPSLYDESDRFEVNPSVGDHFGSNWALSKIAEGVKLIAEENGLVCLDLYTLSNEYSKNIRTAKPNVTTVITGNDRIHPDKNGGYLLGYLMTMAQDSNNVVAEVSINANDGDYTVKNSTVSNVSASSTKVSYDYLPKALPLAVNTQYNYVKNTCGVDIGAINREMIQVNGLEAGNYTVKMDGKVLGTYSSAQLAAGINIAEIDANPGQKQSKELYQIMEQKLRGGSGVTGESNLRYIALAEQTVLNKTKMSWSAYQNLKLEEKLNLVQTHISSRLEQYTGYKTVEAESWNDYEELYQSQRSKAQPQNHSVIIEKQ